MSDYILLIIRYFTDCVNEMKADLSVLDVSHTCLKSQYEDLYGSMHVVIKVDAIDLKKAIDLFILAESWSAGLFIWRYFLPQNMDTNQEMNDLECLRLCSFNCRSLKSSINEIQHLCDLHDIIFLQEHWLLPFELDLLGHVDFYGFGLSAVDPTADMLVSRPFGGTAVLYDKKTTQLCQNCRI